MESVFPLLEPLLPRVQKPIQYVGGELNSTVKDWDAATVRWALMYPDAYEVGLPNQGVMILYELLNERPDALAERTYAVWPDLEALMREHGIPQFTVDGHRPVGAFDVLGVSFATELGYTNLLTALDLAGIPLSAADRTDAHPLVIAGGHAAFNPEPIAEFLDAAVLGDGEQAVGEITSLIAEWKESGQPRRAGRDPAPAGPLRRRVRAALLRRRLPAGRADPAGRAQPDRRPAPGAQAHGDGPGRLAVPEAAAGPAGRVRARADVGGDLPRLHPRLPVLPGRDDHPAGAGALDHRHRRDGAARAGRDRLRRRSACSRCPRPTTARSPTSPAGWPTGTRARTRRCRCRRPGWTRSTSTWPTSCPGTGGAPG